MKSIMLTAIITAITMTLVLSGWAYAQHVKTYNAPACHSN
jgi:hypothetical protein